MRHFLILIISIVLIDNVFAAEAKQTEAKSSAITANISGTAWVTNDIDASIKFYSEFLSFSVRKRIVLDSEASAMVFGVETQELDYASMVPAGWTLENRNGPDLNFIEIPSAAPGQATNDVKRASFLGEIVVAYSVKNLAEIERKMRAADVPVVVPLARSASGRSMTLTVLDPNGIRVQMYEFGL